MKQLNGKNYYISLGYIDPEKRKLNEQLNANDIENIFVVCKGAAIYFDNEDKEKSLSFSLIPVNDIQRKENIFKFITNVFPNYIKDYDVDGKLEYKKFNVVGLFAGHNKDIVQYVQHVAFFETDSRIYKNDPSCKIISVEIPVDKILG